MSHYLLIASRDPFESRDTDSFFRWAIDLRCAGHDVTIFLLQDAVLAARRGAAFDVLALAAAGGVALRADEFALRERGIAGDERLAAVQPVPLDDVIQHLTSGCRAFWH